MSSITNEIKSEQRLQNDAHKTAHVPDGHRSIALITIGNELRSDDGIAAKLADLLPEYTKSYVCRYDLGPYVGLLSRCLAKHEAAVIVDATQSGLDAGTVSIVDLRVLLDKPSQVKISSCHGLSLADELMVAKVAGMSIPTRIVLFGIETESTDGDQGLSSTLTEKLPQLANYLSVLVSQLLEGNNARSNNC